jgi:dihydroorotase
MSAPDLFLKNATIINEGSIFRGHLLLKQGLIHDIIFDNTIELLPESSNIKTIDLEGRWLMPGIIDDQVHFREPGLTHKADLQTESTAAAAGGITSFMEMPNTIPQTTSQGILEEKFRLGQEKSLVNYSFYIGATNENIEELRHTDKNHVCGIKVFMGASTGNMLVDNPESLKRIFGMQRIPIAVHCEDERVISANLAIAKRLYGENIPIRMHPVIRSHDACESSSRLAVSLAERYGTRLHLLHLSTANEMKLLDNSIALSQKQITAEACVHHLWFTDSDYESKGSFIKWNPAIKTKSDRDALRMALTQGYIDVVATDHAPHTFDEKQNAYLSCPSGAPMVQHALVAMLELYHQGVITLEKLVEVMCHNPAICFNIKGRGFIRKGYAADLVVVDPDRPLSIGKDKLYYKCGWSPLEGVEVRSSVFMTLVNGLIVYHEGKINESVRGQALTFSR